MSKRNLQNNIKREKGFIFSDGTLNPAHLLAYAYDVLVEYRIRGAKHGIGDLKTSILECFSYKYPDRAKESLWTEMYQGRAHLKEYRHGDIALDPHDVWSACEDFFQHVAPSGYYFGSLEGDGACIGWFLYEAEA